MWGHQNLYHDKHNEGLLCPAPKRFWKANRTIREMSIKQSLYTPTQPWEEVKSGWRYLKWDNFICQEFHEVTDRKYWDHLMWFISVLQWFVLFIIKWCWGVTIVLSGPTGNIFLWDPFTKPRSLIQTKSRFKTVFRKGQSRGKDILTFSLWFG